jgi:hypothetical protein
MTAWTSDELGAIAAADELEIAPGAQRVQLRMFYLPDEPAQPEEQGKPAESGA